MGNGVRSQHPLASRHIRTRQLVGKYCWHPALVEGQGLEPPRLAFGGGESGLAAGMRLLCPVNPHLAVTCIWRLSDWDVCGCMACRSIVLFWFWYPLVSSISIAVCRVGLTLAIEKFKMLTGEPCWGPSKPAIYIPTEGPQTS